MGGSNSSSSPPPAPAPAGAPEHTAPGTGADGTKLNPTATGPLPGLVSQVLNPPPILGNISGAPSPTTSPKKRPSSSAGGSGTDDNNDDGNPATSNKSGKNSDDDTNTGGGGALSPGLIALLVIILLAVLAGVIFSCYRVRQSRRRRHRSWDEDILKNHAGSVGYSESGGGYGMYVGGKGKPDLWRKNLDLFHRE